MSERGWAMVVILAVMASLAALAAAVWVRLSVANARTADDDRRVQLLWLARSAVPLPAQSRSVTLDGAAVKVVSKASTEAAGRRVQAEASREGVGTARVEALLANDGRVTEWKESYVRPGQPPAR